MLFTQKQVQEIVKLIEDSTNLFIARNLGTRFLSKDQIKRLIKYGFSEKQILSLPRMAYQFGILSQYLKEAELKKISFEDLKKAVQSNKYVPLTAAENYAIEIAEQRAADGITAMSNRIVNTVKGAILKQEDKAKKEYEEIVTSASKRAIQQRRAIKSLAKEIGERTEDWSRDLDRVADYILHEAYDNGRASYIKKMLGKDARVYKLVNKDACDICHELYQENVLTGEPKIFNLSELQANGNNIGRKAKEFRAVIGAAHPFCFLNPKINIYTSNGWKKIKDIKVNDEVMTHKGRFRKVTKLIRHKVDLTRDKIYNLTLETKGRRFTLKGVTGNHPFLQNDKWFSVENIKEGSKLKVLSSGCNECGESLELYKDGKYSSGEKFCSFSCNVSFRNKKMWADPKGRKIYLRATRESIKKTRTPEVLHKMRQKLRLKYINMSLEEKQALTKKANEKTRQMWKEGKLDHTLKNLDKKIKSYSYLEKKMAWLLDLVGIEYIQQYKIERKAKRINNGGISHRNYFVDFYLPEYNLVIECNGYYHNKNIERAKDLHRAMVIKKRIGAETLFFNDDEIRNKLLKCLDKILRVLSNHNGEYHFNDCVLISKEEITNNKQSLRGYGDTLYNFSVEEDESYIANGLAVHNCRCTLNYLLPGQVWSDKTRSFIVPQQTNRKFKKKAKIKVTYS